ncbi:hypothetical protein E8E13_007804 [Curvularia kusanoi]|uniref:Uncharacterized protein n=1 Tax=Curvularia kusanoi TaxID=90978 RepID=A0A9P4W9I1_CURKU|nr:hypothetical protein E8E13_007804 [Curvularia kusanoi]
MPPKKKSASNDTASPATGGGGEPSKPKFAWTPEVERQLLLLCFEQKPDPRLLERFTEALPAGASINGIKIRASNLRMERRRRFDELGWELPEASATPKAAKGSRSTTKKPTATPDDDESGPVSSNMRAELPEDDNADVEAEKGGADKGDADNAPKTKKARGRPKKVDIKGKGKAKVVVGEAEAEAEAEEPVEEPDAALTKLSPSVGTFRASRKRKEPATTEPEGDAETGTAADEEVPKVKKPRAKKGEGKGKGKKAMKDTVKGADKEAEGEASTESNKVIKEEEIQTEVEGDGVGEEAGAD